MPRSTKSQPAAAPALDLGDLVPYPPEFEDAYRAQGYWLGETLPEQLLSAAAAHPERVALVTQDGRWTFATLYEEARSFAAGILSGTALRSGDAVMFQMGNVAETVIAYLGCLIAGLVPVCTLPQHGMREVGLLARHVGARGLIVQSDFGKGQLISNAEALVADGVVEVVVVARGAAFPGAVSFDALVSGDPLPGVTAASSAIAVFQLSGGTTGLPKVAPRLHAEYAYNSRVWAQALGWGPGTVALYVLPLMHNAGIALALQPALLSGATLVLAPSADISVMLECIAAHRPNSIPLLTPALAIRLLEAAESREADFTAIADFVIGGQRLPVEVAENLRDILGIRVRQMFGMAEGMFMLTPPGAGEDVRHHTVGAPISAGDEVRILLPGTEVEVDAGEVGELVTRGPYTIRGYYRAALHNQTAFTADGFYRTGDLAARHIIGGEVFYSIEGRIKDVINRGAEKIHAEEVEELIMRHDAVRNVALVAMSDPVLGERGCAYLVMEDGHAPLTVPVLGAHLSSLGLAKYKLPERVEIRTALPMSNVGKVSKKELREDIERLLAAEVAGS